MGQREREREQPREVVDMGTQGGSTAPWRATAAAHVPVYR
jgi:hypothetical protein